LQAFKRVKSNKGSPGIDGMTVEQLRTTAKWDLQAAAGETGRDTQAGRRGASIGHPDGRPQVPRLQPYKGTRTEAAHRRQGDGALQAKSAGTYGRKRGISIEQMTKELSSYLRGWKGYFGFCETPSVLERLDQWIRQRLRSVIWKQWKRGRIRFAKLHQRGVSRDLAAQTAGSSHGPWRIANSPAMKYAFPNAYFDLLGLPRLYVGE
jgi:hypothetical protein